MAIEIQMRSPLFSARLQAEEEIGNDEERDTSLADEKGLADDPNEEEPLFGGDELGLGDTSEEELPEVE